MPFEQINAETYAAFISPPGLAIVHFWAPWDMCHASVRRAIEAAIDRVGCKVRLAMWDTDDRTSFDAVQGLAIANVPTVLYFMDGTQVGMQVGNRSTEVISEALGRIRDGERVGRIG